MDEQIPTGVRLSLRELYPEQPEQATALGVAPLELSAVRAKWWNEDADVDMRIEELLFQARVESCEEREVDRERVRRRAVHGCVSGCVPPLLQLRYSPRASVVLVGHSHFFRELLRTRCADS